MGQNLGPLNIKDTYQSLVQISGSVLTDGTGSTISTVNVSASTATSASYAQNATAAGYATNSDFSVSASYATTASYALNVPVTASYAVSASHANASDTSLSASVATSASYATTASYALNVPVTASYAVSASHANNADSSLTSNTATSASYATNAGFATTSTSASHAVNADNAVAANTATSASYATTASHALGLVDGLTINAASISASTATFTSASIGYLQTVTGSATIIGDAFIILNTNTPTSRYAGLIVEDSGSAPTNYTASFFFDSLLNDWNYEYTSGSTDYGVALFGPEYNTKGSPVYITANRLTKGEGTHHLVDSNISDDGTTVSINSDVDVTGSITVLSGSVAGTVVDNIGTPTASLAIKHIVSLTQAEYNALTPDINTYYVITDSTESTFTNISASGWISASTFVGDGSQLTGIAAGFPFTGSAGITGSLIVNGNVSLAASDNFNITGSNDALIATDTNSKVFDGTYNYSAVVGGTNNRINSDKSVIAGGTNNQAGYGSGMQFIGGGEQNSITNTYGAIIGGYNNQVTTYAERGAVVGGSTNQANNTDSVVIGGYNNRVDVNSGNLAVRSVVIGGQNNRVIDHSGSVVLGGDGLYSTDHHQVVVPQLLISQSGGGITFPDGTTQTTAGGGGGAAFPYTGSASITGSLVITGSLNSGDQNTPTGLFAAAVAGVQNNASGERSANVGGFQNSVTSTDAANLGGYGNTVSGLRAGAVAGVGNTVSNAYSVVVGGASLSTSKDEEVVVKHLTTNGQVTGVVNAISDSGGTTTMDCSTGNFFTLAMPAGGSTTLTATNVTAGQTINVRTIQNATPSTIAFSANIQFAGGTAFTVSTGSGEVDVMTFVSFDGTSLQGTGLQNFF